MQNCYDIDSETKENCILRAAAGTKIHQTLHHCHSLPTDLFAQQPIAVTTLNSTMSKLAVCVVLALVAAAQAYKIPPVVTNFDVLDKDSSGHVDRTEVDKHLDAQFDVSIKFFSVVQCH